MANVNIKFNNKDYLLSCDDGQEENLEKLANHLDSKYNDLKNNLGNIGENKLLLITAIKMVDDYFDLFKKVKNTKSDFEKLSVRFKELRSLAIKYKDDKDLEIEKLKKELEDLKNNQRPKVVEAIAEARAHGDLKENAEYHAAKEQQGHIEGRVLEINDVIARANVIDVTKIENSGKIIFGSTVTVNDLSKKEKTSFKIVGKDEANMNENLIYFKSPMGKSLIGKQNGDLVNVSTPSGEKSFEVIKVEYI